MACCSPAGDCFFTSELVVPSNLVIGGDCDRGFGPRVLATTVTVAQLCSAGIDFLLQLVLTFGVRYLASPPHYVSVVTNDVTSTRNRWRQRRWTD